MGQKEAKSKRDVVNEAAEGLLQMFRTGEMPEAVALTIIRRQQGDDQPSFHWSIGNQILMLFQGTSDARGFRQWQEVNRFVKKGAKALYILGPLTMKVKDVDQNSGQETERIIITGFKGIPVFRYEDTDGEPLEKADYTPPKLPSFTGVAEYLGIQIEYAACSGGYYGSYSPSQNKITLCSQDEFVYYHELAMPFTAPCGSLKRGQIRNRRSWPKQPLPSYASCRALPVLSHKLLSILRCIRPSSSKRQYYRR